MNYISKGFSLSILLLAFAVNAAISVKQMTGHPTSSQTSLRPYIEVINDGTEEVDLSELSLSYYIFEENLLAEDLVWENYWNSGNIDYSMTFSDLDETYESNGLKANIKCEMTFGDGSVIAAGTSLKFQQGIHKNSWDHTFNELDDWSYSNNDNYTYNENIVVINKESGEVIAGNDISTHTPRPYNVEVHWIGNHHVNFVDTLPIKEGDAYFDVSSQNSYVFFQGSWKILTKNILAGGTLTDSQSHIYMNGSDLQNANNISASAVTANYFYGDGSNLSGIDLELENGSVEYNHLSADCIQKLSVSALDPLLAVNLNEETGMFDIYCFRNNTTSFFVSYTYKRSNGATIEKSVLYPASAEFVSVDGSYGDSVFINTNDAVYKIDPLKQKAGYPVPTVLMRLDGETITMTVTGNRVDEVWIQGRFVDQDGNNVMAFGHRMAPGLKEVSWDVSNTYLKPGYGVKLKDAATYNLSNGQDEMSVYLPYPIIDMKLDGDRILMTRSGFLSEEIWVQGRFIDQDGNTVMPFAHRLASGLTEVSWDSNDQHLEPGYGVKIIDAASYDMSNGLNEMILYLPE